MRLHENETVFDIGMQVENRSGKPMELMYMAHVNFAFVARGRIVQPVPFTSEHVQVRRAIPAHVQPDADYLAFIDALARSPGEMEYLHQPARYDPEQVFYLKDLPVDESGDTYMMLLRPQGDAFNLRHAPAQLPHCVRWILDDPDQKVAAFSLPATCEPEGYAAVRRKGQLRRLRPAEEAVFSVPRRLSRSCRRDPHDVAHHPPRTTARDSPMSARIGVIGSNMVDLVTYVGRMPNAGETLEAPFFEMGAGGKGANQAVAAAKLGSDVLMVGCVGDDLFGRNTMQNFADLGIDARHVRTVPGLPSGVAPIFVEPNGENRILIVKGANEALGEADIEAAAGDLRSCALILLQLEIPLPSVYYAIAWARQNHIPVLLNPAPASTALSIAGLAGVDFLAPNQTELAILTGLATDTPAAAEAAARTLLVRGIGAVIVTLGADGALFVQADATHRIAPVPVQARDTTGAGDAFIGAFAHYHAAGHDLLHALNQAARYAADAVTRPGTQKSFADGPGFAAFCRRLEDDRGLPAT